MVQYPLRMLFTLTGVVAAFLGGWQLIAPESEWMYQGNFWGPVAFLAVGLTSAASILIHGRWQIVPWFLAGFACAALVIFVTFGWGDDAEANYFLAALCCGPAALLSSVVLVKHGGADDSDNGHDRCHSLHGWIPWLCLFPACALTGLFSRYLFIFSVEIGFDTRHVVDSIFPLLSVLFLAIVLIHGSWRVVPWCVLAFGVSAVAMALLSHGYGLQTQAGDYYHLATMSCGPSALLGAAVILWRGYRARRAVLAD